IQKRHGLPHGVVLKPVRRVRGGVTPRSINLRGENPQSRRDAELSPFLISNLKKPRSNIFTDRVRIVAVSFLGEDRKSTRLNSSHVKNSYAVFCLKQKKTDTA